MVGGFVGGAGWTAPWREKPWNDAFTYQIPTFKVHYILLVEDQEQWIDYEFFVKQYIREFEN
jgi:hypothetical protein